MGGTLMLRAHTGTVTQWHSNSLGHAETYPSLSRCKDRQQ